MAQFMPQGAIKIERFAGSAALLPGALGIWLVAFLENQFAFGALPKADPQVPVFADCYFWCIELKRFAVAPRTESFHLRTPL